MHTSVNGVLTSVNAPFTTVMSNDRHHYLLFAFIVAPYTKIMTVVKRQTTHFTSIVNIIIYLTSAKAHVLGRDGARTPFINNSKHYRHRQHFSFLPPFVLNKKLGHIHQSYSTLLTSALWSTLDSSNNHEVKEGVIPRIRYNVGQTAMNTNTIGNYWSYQDPVQKTLNHTNVIKEDQEHNRAQTDASSQQLNPVSSDGLVDSILKTDAEVKYELGVGKNIPVNAIQTNDNTGSIIIAKDSEGKFLSRALWLYGENKENDPPIPSTDTTKNNPLLENMNIPLQTIQTTRSEPIRYEDIDASLPVSVYDPGRGIDLVWDLMRQEAQREAAREPLLVSFIYSTILNHPSLESALAFHLSNRLASPAMLSIQIMSLFEEAFGYDEGGSNRSMSRPFTLGKNLRADILAVRDRDPACTCLPDVFLYFKGFHALQTHKVSHYLWTNGRKTLAYFFQSQMAQIFQIDIHPNADIGRGIMIDHGTGVVIGETAVLGDNCSVLHHVTLGGSGRKGEDRHPKIGNGVLLGAGCTVLGNIHVGDGCQIGAGTLVISDLPPHSVAVGVPARIIGTFINDNEVPSQSMDQMLVDGDDSSVTNVEFSI